MAMFERAEHVNIYGGSFAANAGSSPKGLDKLVDAVAPHAILNAGGRADEVRCFPGTREEVIGKLEKFMDDNSPGRKRMMWLSGPAGAGKSAIFQTVAERRGEQAVNFFFFRGDSTRSHSKPLVATLVYQLRSLYPALDEPLSNYLAKDPLICSAPVEKQFKQLISSPIEKIQQSTPIHERIVLIIDGLDECSNDTRDQDQILTALHTLAHADNSSFLVLVSSRAEPQLVMSFNRLGNSVQSIFLNGDYKPEQDIHRFVVKKFAEIKRDHHLARTLSEKWPTSADIDAIIIKSSGHFIYAATVMRYIQFSSSSPALSLVKILEMPLSIDHNPLAHLDAVYSHIFSKAHSIRAVKLILFARYCTKSRVHSGEFVDALRLAGYNNDIEVESIFADLVAIIKVVPGTNDLLQFYHASLEDYLTNKSRSTIYYVNDNEIAAEFSSMCLTNFHDADSILLIVDCLSCVQKPTPELSKSLLAASTKYVGHDIGILFNVDDLMAQIRKLYWDHDKDQFKILLQSWTRFVHINNLERKAYHSRLEATNPSASQYFEEYCMAERYTGYEPRRQSDSAHTGMARSDIRVISATESPNMAIDNPVRNPSVLNPGASRRNDPYNNIGTQTGTAEWWRTVEDPARSHAFLSVSHERFDPLGRQAMHPQSPSTSHPLNIHKEEEGASGSREYDNGSLQLSKIRVKFYYRHSIRSMALTPDTSFSEFVNKITAKFGKDLNHLTVKFKDEYGDQITICDDSDYEHAIETVQRRSKGQVVGLLEIWCQDRV